MLMKFVLLAICMSGTLGHLNRSKGDRDTQPLEQFIGSSNPKQQLQDLDLERSSPEWQALAKFVQMKIEGMERLLSVKDERVDQLEMYVTSQGTEIKRLKQEVTSLEQAIMQKDGIVDRLVKMVSDLKRSVTLDYVHGEHESRHISRSDFLMAESEDAELGRRTSYHSIPGVGNMSSNQNRSTVSLFRKDNEKGTDQRQNQSDENVRKVQAENNSRHSSISTFSGNHRKGAVPSSLQQTIAFHVFLSSDKWVVNDDVVVFDEVALDHGYGYKPRLGIYVAPESGTYVVTWTMLCYGQELFRTLLVLNGSVKGSSWTDAILTKDIQQTAALVVLSMNQGDHLFIRMGPIFGNGTILSRNDLAVSTFSGWKLD
ncbi:uncharacterized protein LOC117339876 [Pecten maximus]|uniref:uncharacterized protein LOC117339876 n=1 Tax=Pecten maximus TaxID=6579 RepID=UPI00145891E6|nr:uncharacterized protein LOC117339876 [Pecten maximus]